MDVADPQAKQFELYRCHFTLMIFFFNCHLLMIQQSFYYMSQKKVVLAKSQNERHVAKARIWKN